MKQCILALMVSFLLLPSISMAAEPDSLSFDGVAVRIGAPKNEVRQNFAEGYTIAEQNDTWGIFTKERFLGTIQFENGYVRSIVKNWSDYRMKSSGLKSFQLLFNLLSNLTKQGFTIAHISTSEVKKANLTEEVIVLKMNSRTVEISIQNSLSGEGYAVHIDETLSK